MNFTKRKTSKPVIEPVKQDLSLTRYANKLKSRSNLKAGIKKRGINLKGIWEVRA